VDVGRHVFFLNFETDWSLVARSPVQVL